MDLNVIFTEFFNIKYKNYPGISKKGHILRSLVMVPYCVKHLCIHLNLKLQIYTLVKLESSLHQMEPVCFNAQTYHIMLLARDGLKILIH